MNHSPKNFYESAKNRQIFYKLAAVLSFLLVIASCSPKTETVTVEVTRVVVETVVEEGETVEVTRVVTETIVETIEIEPESIPDEAPPAATGSEGDAGPLPPPPNDGPKVTERRGFGPAADVAVETAVVLRNSQDSNPALPQPNLVAVASFSSIERSKWCTLAADNYKKQCI